jgi:hypothetical protein
MKREFLVENQSDLKIYLQKNSLSCKLYRYKDKNSYVYKFEDYVFVLEEYKDFNKLVLISEEDIGLESPIKTLEEITNDKRYSKEYIEIFGSPKSYEFDEKKVFEKCDDAGLSKLALHFKMGMSSDKVFRVILYRLNQVFTLQYARKKDLEYAKLENTHKRLLKVLKLSKDVFDKEIISRIIDDFEDLYMLLNHQNTYERFVLNFQMFIYEKSFYNLADGDSPIGFYKKKDKLFKLGTV